MDLPDYQIFWIFRRGPQNVQNTPFPEDYHIQFGNHQCSVPAPRLYHNIYGTFKLHICITFSISSNQELSAIYFFNSRGLNISYNANYLLINTSFCKSQAIKIKLIMITEPQAAATVAAQLLHINKQMMCWRGRCSVHHFFLLRLINAVAAHSVFITVKGNFLR